MPDLNRQKLMLLEFLIGTMADKIILRLYALDEMLLFIIL